MKKILRICLGVVLILAGTVLPGFASSSAVRTIANNNTTSPTVSVLVTPDASASVYAVEESLPTGLTPSNINESGVWDSGNRKVKWGPFFDHTTRTLSFGVTGGNGSYTLNGTASFDGVGLTITGNSQLTIGSGGSSTVTRTISGSTITVAATPASTVSSYAVEDLLPVGVTPSNINESGVWDSANRKVKWGPFFDHTARTLSYTACGSGTVSGVGSFDGVSVTTTGATSLAACGGGSSTVVRTISGSSVAIAAAPASTVSAYAVEDSLPTGITPNNINESGQWDSANRKVKWGPFFDHNARTLSYAVSGTQGTYTLSGFGSFDGASTVITGANQVTISPTNYADLTITNFTASVSGSNITYQLTAVNQGNASVSQNFYIDLFYDRTTAPGQTNEGEQYISIAPLDAGQTQIVTFMRTNAPTGTYQSWCYIDSYANTVSESNETNNVAGPITVIVGAVPANDNFANRISIAAPNLTASGNNINASKESNEPNHANNSGGKSVWWTWQAIASGNTTVSTAGSDFDTLLAVYTGTSVSALSLIVANDDDPSANILTSRTDFNAVAGTTYQIAVDGFDGTSGSIQLRITPPGVQKQLTGMSLNDGVFRFVLNGSVGSSYVIQVSSNLVNWLPFSTNTIPASGWLLITDPGMINQPRRFYRAVGGNTSVAPTNMALIPAGNFTMGDTFSEGTSDELPLHSVYVSAFYMDQYEVTKALWDDVYNWAITHGYSFDNGGSGKAANHPVQTIDWYDCVKWCNARSEKEGRTPAYYTSAAQTTVYRTGTNDLQENFVKWNTGYRLPTEAEWEKAARGGAGGQRFPWGNTISWSQANYYAYPLSAGGYAYDVNPTAGFHPTFAVGGVPYTSPVGYFAANGYGVYDMAGNVSVWCWDWFGPYSSGSQTDPQGSALGSYRVSRGGGWDAHAVSCRAAGRYGDFPAGRSYYVGFRSVLSPGQ